MRDIKFRGIELESGIWVYGSLVSYDPCPEIQSTELSENAYDYDKWEVNPETVGQFTGLKDKNGVEIYEGDVIKVNAKINVVTEIFEPTEEVDQEIICEVIFNEKFAAFELETIEEDYHLKAWGFYDEPDDLEVIENIHENPELLK